MSSDDIDASRKWLKGGLDEAALSALRSDLPSTTLWSMLIDVLERRAEARTPADLNRQWRSDRFVAPAYIDQRTLVDLDRELFAAADQFEAVELSPLAPLGVCSQVAPTSQNRVVSTARGTEVVSDPSNVLALESARRLRDDAGAVVRLATSHRCVRAQEIPPLPGFAAHFRMFCMTSAAHETKDQGFTVSSLLEHIRTHWRALDRLERIGYRFPERQVRLLSTAVRRPAAERIAAQLTDLPVVREELRHEYYDGLRFMLGARSSNGADIPLIDGGAFDWVAKLTANRKMVFIASAIGSQLAAYLYRG